MIVLLWFVGVLLALVGVVLLLQGHFLVGLVLLVVGCLVGPGGYSLLRRRVRG